MLNIMLITVAFFVSVISGFVAIPLILNYCKEKKLYDMPNVRKVHKNLVPRLGGVAFMPSMILAFILALFVLGRSYNTLTIQINLWSLYFLLSLLIIYTIGLIDDLTGLRAKTKFFIQILAAAIMPMSGLYINNLYGLFGLHDIPFALGAPITVLTIVFVVNAMNLIDGIDGLCASLSEMALIVFLYLFYQERLYVYCILIAGLIGVLIPYLYFNIYGTAEKNRKIFMGDSGSLTLGFILGFLFVKYSMDNTDIMYFRPDRMPIAYSLLIVPTFDVVRVVLHRIRTHHGIFEPDKNHIHHKLMNANLSMHQSLIVILALAIFFIIINSFLYPITGFTTIFLLDIVIYTAFHVTLNFVIIKKVKHKKEL